MKALFQKMSRAKCELNNALWGDWGRGWTLHFALATSLIVGVGLGCAHSPAKEKGASATFDLVREGGVRSNLGSYLGQIVVVDVCASWSDPCLANARAVSEACDVLCDDDVQAISVLLDDLGAQALQAYSHLELSQEVWLPGPNAREGLSAVGPLATIPRVMIFDREGRLVSEQTGGIVQSRQLIEAVRAMQR